MNKQPEALRLADILEGEFEWLPVSHSNIAAELRRLHEVNQELLEALNKIEKWKSHNVGLAVDFGSNGVRDFYRNIAKAAITKAGGSNAT